LTATEVTQYLAARFPQQQFPSELGGVIHQSTEGNPLFMVNVVDYWVSQGRLDSGAAARQRFSFEREDLLFSQG